MSGGRPAIEAPATIAMVAVIGIQLEQAAEAADVARAGLVIDDAGVHEQRGLEGGVVEDVEHGGHRRAACRSRAAWSPGRGG